GRHIGFCNFGDRSKRLRPFHVIEFSGSDQKKSHHSFQEKSQDQKCTIVMVDDSTEGAASPDAFYKWT
ncbi:hypothetical protein SKAU_G00376800, partial [Synaphobranchus kaupii]